MNPLIQLKTIPPVLITLTLICFVLLPNAQAVVPPPDGGYPNLTTAEGTKALQSLTTGSANTAVGWSSLLSNAAGSFNTGVGAGTLALNTGDSNTAVGAVALLFNTTGTENTANGTAALELNETGSYNTANGAFALFSNTVGYGNTAVGLEALFSNTTGTLNTAIGEAALTSNTTGSYNTANGSGALLSNTIGNSNTATGVSALFSNSVGYSNTATGGGALKANGIGFDNTATGFNALTSNITGSGNTATGFNALGSNITGTLNTAIGVLAGTGVVTADNVICIGVGGADVSNTTWIGNVYGVPTQSGTTAPVVVSDTGQFGTVASSERFKKDISTMHKASEAILSLRPVTFHYKTDTTGTPQFGLIAEEVAKVNSALVLPDKEGKPYTVRYEAVNAMLLNEFLKEHRKVQELEANAVRQQKQIEVLTAGLQKVSARLEASKPAPQVVNNP